MANSMDMIQITYGVSLTGEEQRMLDMGMNEELKNKVKTCSILEFIYPERYPQNEPLVLTETEKNIQKALRKVYELNEKDPPLYRKFPTFRSDEQPLIIDLTTAGRNKGDYAAVFEGDYNRVKFEQIDIPNYLVTTIAHELKHAEQCDEEMFQWDPRSSNTLNNAYAYHQIQFLKEAQAFACGARVAYELLGDDAEQSNAYREVDLYKEISKKYTDATGKKDYKKIEEEMIKALLDKLYTGPHYKDQYDSKTPIGDNDAGLDKIPEAFNLPQSLITKIKEAPKIAKSLSGKLLQATKNHRWDDVISLCQNALQNNEKINEAPLYKMLKMASPKQVQKLLELKKSDNEYLISEKIISYVFQGIKDPTLLSYYISAKREGKNIINKKMLIRSFCNSISDKEHFNSLAKLMKNEQGHLPFTSNDLTENGNNKLLKEFCFSRVSLVPEMLPEILKLKGKNGKSLVTPKILAENLGKWCAELETPESIQDMFNTIKNEKGNLPFSRKIFDTNQGENHLLKGINSLFTAKGNPLEKLPILMSLKDKDGKPIISQENIDKFPENTPLSKAVKAYKRSSIKQAIQNKAKAGAKRLEQNPEGYVRRRTKKKQKSIPTPSALKKDNHTL